MSEFDFIIFTSFSILSFHFYFMCHFLIKWSLNEYYKNLTKASKMINCAKCIN